MKRRLTHALAMATLGAVLLAGCGGSAGSTQPAGQTPTAANKDAILKIGLNADPPKLDPHQSTALVDRQVFQSIFDKLVDLDKDLKIVPMLAEKFEVSEDGKTYTFKIRQGVKFHDGTDLNAEAVKYNFDRMLDAKIPALRRTEMGKVSQVTVVDPYTVKVELKEPFAGFLFALTDRAGMMVCPEVAKKAGLDFLNEPCGTGPFKFKERVKGDSITLVRNDSYWQQGLPKAAGVVYKTVTDENVRLVQLQGGQLDMIESFPQKQVAAAKSDSRIKVQIIDGLEYQGLFINVTKAPLNDKRVRQALEAAIDREGLVKVVFGDTSKPGNSAFSPASPAFEGVAIPKRDVAKAKQLLADAGFAGGIELKFMVSPTPTNQQIAQVLQNMWAEAGIKVTIEQVEFGQMLEKAKSLNYDITQIGWSGRPDPDGNIYNFVKTGASNNYSGYSNPQIDEKLDAARKLTDMAQRKKIYGEIMTTVRDEAPYLYLWWPGNVKGFGAGIQGYEAIPDGMIRTATISK